MPASLLMGKALIALEDAGPEFSSRKLKKEVPMTTSTLVLTMFLSLSQLVSIDSKDMDLSEFFRVMADVTRPNECRASSGRAGESKPNGAARSRPCVRLGRPRTICVAGFRLAQW